MEKLVKNFQEWEFSHKNVLKNQNNNIEFLYVDAKWTYKHYIKIIFWDEFCMKILAIDDDKTVCIASKNNNWIGGDDMKVHVWLLLLMWFSFENILDVIWYSIGEKWWVDLMQWSIKWNPNAKIIFLLLENGIQKMHQPSLPSPF